MTKHVADWPAAIVESSKDAIVAHDLSGMITVWNDAARVLLGYRSDEVRGRLIDMLIPPSGLEEEQRLRARLAGDVDVSVCRTSMLARDGHIVEVSATFSRVVSSAGVTLGVSRALRGVGGHLEGDNPRSSEASRSRGRFFGNMSHELRTPLISIIGFTDLLYSGAVGIDSPKHHEFLGYISSSGHHLLKLIDDMLEASKAALGSLDFSPEPVRLTVLVAHTLNILQSMIRHKRLAVACDVDPEVDALDLDASRLRQVIYNFLSNAITCSQHDGRVSIRAHPHGPAHFRLEVEDDGVGIGTDALTTLFDDSRPRDTLLPGDGAQGTGLGLALARRLIEAQGGRVGVRSMPGGGAIFRFVLNRRHGTGGHGLDL